MKNIDNKLAIIDNFRGLYSNIDLISLDNLPLIDDISKIFMDNSKYLTNENFANSVNILVEFIEEFNNTKDCYELIDEFKLNLKVALYKFIEDLIKDLNLKVYFYGKDRYGFINEKFLNFPIRIIKNNKDMNLVLKSIKRDSSSYKVLLVENERINFNRYSFDEVINYGYIANVLYKSKESVYKVNYEFNYLFYGLEYIKDKKIDKVFVGNSYPLNGLSEDILGDVAIKLNLSSQDLYYSFELLKKAYENNSNLKKCLFGISYYILNHDLSKGDSEYSRDMIENVYLNLLNDPHNSKSCSSNGLFTINSVNIDLLIKTIFELDEIDRYLKYEVYKSNRAYYNNINPRFYSSSYTKGDIEYKTNVAKERASKHNKLIKYKETEYEYKAILDNMIKFCEDRGIMLEFVVFPVTDLYYEYLSTEFKDKFNLILQYLEGKNLKIYDLRDKKICNISEDDFIDSDHLAESGSIKITNYLKNLI